MIDELIRQLKNPDPDVRKRAIMALGKAKDPSALNALAQVVRGDPDPTLRELARKAGQYIRQQTKKTTRGPEDKDLPTTGMLTRPNSKNEAPPPPPAPPLRRSERKALAAQPPPPPLKKVVRPIDAAEDMPETGALLGKRTPPAASPAPNVPPAPQQTPTPPPRPSLLDRAANKPISPFISSDDDDEPDTLAALRDQQPDEQDDDEPDYLAALSDQQPDEQDDDEPDYLAALREQQPAQPERAPLYEDDEADFPPGLGDEAPIEPLRAPPLYFEKEAPPKADEPQPVVKGSSLVKGRKYNVNKQDEKRAHEYVNAALSNNLDGDNAKAMKNLTEAIALNPNLINEGFFTNVAVSVTGLEGDAAVQMIIDGKERKRFTEGATRKQKVQRVEKHLDEAKQSTWADFWFAIVFYGLIVTFGPLFVTLVESESIKNLLANFAKNSAQLPAQLRTAQLILTNIASVSPVAIGLVYGVTSVLALLLQTVIINFLAKMLGGNGTWRHLTTVLLSFYNKWYLIFYIILAVAVGFAFLSLFSPIMLCFVLVVVILALYILMQTATKIGVAYDFGAAKGFVTLLLSGIVILVINILINYALAQVLGQTFKVRLG